MFSRKGRPWEAIEFYLRALYYNPKLPEALCGLVASLSSICDWRDMGFPELTSNAVETGDISQSHSSGYLRRMMDVCAEQIQAAFNENLGLPFDLSSWLQVVTFIYGRNLSRDEELHWSHFLQVLTIFEPSDAKRKHVNNSGLLLRLIDWVRPRCQRRWYILAYGKTQSTVEQMAPTTDNPLGAVANCIELPKAMLPPSIPALLPFNTVST